MILTAAHCYVDVRPASEKYSAFSGAFNGCLTEESTRIKRGIRRWEPNPGYRDSKDLPFNGTCSVHTKHVLVLVLYTDHDLALALLSSPFPRRPLSAPAAVFPRLIRTPGWRAGLGGGDLVLAGMGAKEHAPGIGMDLCSYYTFVSAPVNNLLLVRLLRPEENCAQVDESGRGRARGEIPGGDRVERWGMEGLPGVSGALLHGKICFEKKSSVRIGAKC